MYIYFTYILHTFLVKGKISITSNHLLDPVRDRLDQFSRVRSVVYSEDPQHSDLILQLLQVGGIGLPQLPLHPGPHILDRVEVRAVAWPFDELDVQLTGICAIETYSLICRPNKNYLS